MNVRHVLSAPAAITLAATLVVTVPVAAQGIPKGASLRGGTTVAATRLMVANPYVFKASDSATAVDVGRTMRARMTQKAPRTDYSVITDSLMNAALVSFGYAPDAILAQDPARRLAQSIAGRVLVTSQMTRLASGQWTMLSRLSGVNDDAGVSIRVNQAGRTPALMGQAAVDSLQEALKVLADARECMDLRASKPDRAASKAQAVLKQMPDNGLAHYCLAQLAKDTTTKVKELQAAVAGDSLSIKALNELAAIYQARSDTTQAVATLQQLLIASPADQTLRQQIFRYLLQLGRSQAAIEVADEGLKVDPTNWDLWDLKSNACLFSSDFRCAMQALESAYAADSTHADSLFFAKIGIAAEQQLADTTGPDKATAADTASYIKWAKLGAAKFPSNLTMLKNLNKAYSFSGQVDSSLVVTRKILAQDNSDVTPALAAAQALLRAKRYGDAMEFIDFVQKNGDDGTHQQAAGLMVNAAVPLLQPPAPQWDTAGTLLRKGVELAPSASFSPTMNYLLGVADLQLAASMDDATAKAKSCDGARKMDSLLVEAEPALVKGIAYRADAQKLVDNVRQYRARTQGMIKAYCK